MSAPMMNLGLAQSLLPDAVLTGDPTTPDPVWNFHNSWPVLASNALR